MEEKKEFKITFANVGIDKVPKSLNTEPETYTYQQLQNIRDIVNCNKTDTKTGICEQSCYLKDEKDKKNYDRVGDVIIKKLVENVLVFKNNSNVGHFFNT